MGAEGVTTLGCLIGPVRAEFPALIGFGNAIEELGTTRPAIFTRLDLAACFHIELFQNPNGNI